MVEINEPSLAVAVVGELGIDRPPRIAKLPIAVDDLIGTSIDAVASRQAELRTGA